MARHVLAFLPSPGPIELLVMALMVLGLAVSFWAIIDAASRPEKEWRGIDQNKTLWVIMMLLATLFCAPLGLLMSIYYLAVLRPRLNAPGGPPL